MFGVVFTTGIEKKNSITIYEYFLMLITPCFESKNKLKLLSNFLGLENKTSPQKPLLSNLLMDGAKLHVYVPTQLFIIIPTSLDKLAVAPGEISARYR